MAKREVSLEDVGLKNPSKEDIQKGLELLAKKKDRDRRIEAGEIKGGGKSWSEMTEDEKAKYREREKKRRVRKNLLFQKMEAALEKAGVTIEVTDKEVEAAMAK